MSNPYVGRVVLKPESGQGDPGGYSLVGSGPDLRTVLEDLLAGVARLERDATGREHAVVVGDASGRSEQVYLGVRVDADTGRHMRKTRQLWRFYDSQLAGLVALIVVVLTFVGAHTVWEWISARLAVAS